MSESTALATMTEGARPSVARLGAGGIVSAIIPQTFDEVWRFSQVLAKSGLCPFGMDTPEKVSVAILTGMEIGAKPMQAVQGIAVIGGRPCVWGDLSLGLVRSNPEFEYINEFFEGEEPADWTVAAPQGADLKFKAVCIAKRKGEPEVRREFSIGDAVVGKLWGKKNRSGSDTPWITGPKRMLQMRARAFALRDLFTDVLKGLYIAEELIGTAVDENSTLYAGRGEPQIAGPQAPDDAEEVTAEEVTAAQESAPRREEPAPIVKPSPEEGGGEPDAIGDDWDPEAWVMERRVEFHEAKTEAAVDAIHTMFEGTANDLPQALRIQYEDAHQEALARFASGQPTKPEEPAGPDAPDDDFPGNDAIRSMQGDEGPGGPDGPDDEDEDATDASEAGEAFKRDMQAIIEAEGRTKESIKEAFDSRVPDLEALLADGDLTPQDEEEIRAAFRTEYKRLKADEGRPAGTGDAAADAMTERLRVGLAECQDVGAVNKLSTETLPERNAFGSKHPLSATWKTMVTERRKALSAIG